MPALIQIVDAALADAARRSGEHLVCRPGCMQCCVGVFAISQQDAARLRDGMNALTRADAPRAERLRERVATSAKRLECDFPGDVATGLLAEDEMSREHFDEGFAEDEICPVLDPTTGTCDLYTARPILCRTFGPAVMDEEGNLAACELCYTAATVEEIAAGAIDSGIRASEGASNEAFDTKHGVGGETIVAFALRGC